MRQACILLLLLFGWIISPSAQADGCFVFKWNKAIDINEPTQKAVIVHDAGREDLLLQVKYEGPLEEFGWLIPVPSLPKVEKGSMEAFYELSQLTQRRFGETKGNGTLGMAVRSGGEETINVIEIKTVGAYEVAVLSAKDSGSLSRWLQAHDYSLPEAKSEIMDDYIRKGWYFVAARIQLNKGVAFKSVSSTAPKDSEAPRTALRKKLSSGELHPLLISFDTPKCIFPLKISAMNDKPSEVSLYVISREPLLEGFNFGKAGEKLAKSYGEWTGQKAQRFEAQTRSMRNMRAMQLALMMYRENSTNRFAAPDRRRPRNWSTEDLNALAAESQRQLPDRTLSEEFFAAPEELLHEMRLESGKIPKCAQVLPRLKRKDWHLTKVVRTFAPPEMRDLEFEPAIPALARVVPEVFGNVAAELLARFGEGAMPSLVAACKSKNSAERLNAVCGLERGHKAAPAEVLLTLLKDEAPQVRPRAVRLAHYSDRNQKFTEPMIELLSDPHLEIGQEASGWLANHESTNRIPFYLGLLNNPHPKVRMHALGIASASAVNRHTPSDEVVRAALRALKDNDEDVQSSAMYTLAKCHQPIPKADLLSLLDSSLGDTAMFAANLLYWANESGIRVNQGFPVQLSPPPKALL